MTNHNDLIDTIDKTGQALMILALSPIPMFFLLLGAIFGILLLARKVA